MVRTAVNVTGDAVVTLIVAKSEGRFEEAVFNQTGRHQAAQDLVSDDAPNFDISNRMQASAMPIQCTIVPVTPYQQNCSIIKCETTGKAAIVDPGGDVERILAAVEKWGRWSRRSSSPTPHGPLRGIRRIAPAAGRAN